MRRFLLCIFAFVWSITLFAQFSTTPTAYTPTEHDGLDAIFIFPAITAGTTLTYTGSDFVEWQQWDGTFQSNQPDFSPDEGGYRVKRSDGTLVYVWVFDWTNYAVTIESIAPVLDAEDRCEALSLDVVLDDLNKELKYTTSTGAEKSVKRTFTLTYNDVTWNENAWDKQEEKLVVNYPFTSIVLERSPRCNTHFTLVDDLSKELGVTTELTSDLFNAVAIEVHPKGEVVKRESETEFDQSSTSSTVSGESKNCKCKQLEEYAKETEATHDPVVGGSAPLVVDFKSNANEDAANFVEWNIYTYGNNAGAIRYTERDFRFTFVAAGEYVIKATATSDGCNAVDSVIVVVFDSFIDTPNVFTPNGDGVNDEFRAVYRSLTEFHGWVYNRWGRLVFSWTDPAKGWNGKINGKNAAAGAYYYVIQATGADKDSRGKELIWKCSGDINLLR